MCLQSLTWHKDEQHAERNCGQQEDAQDGERPLHDQPLDVWLTNDRESHERVLAESDKPHDWVKAILVSRNAVDTDGEWQNQPATSVLSLIEEDEDKRSPETTKQSQESENETEHAGGWGEVTEGLHAEESWEGVALHSLVDVVLSGIENLWVIAAELLNGDGDIMGDRVWKDDLALGAWEEESVKNLLSRVADIGASNGVSWRVGGFGRGMLWGGHEAWARWLAVGGRLADSLHSLFGADAVVWGVAVANGAILAEVGGHLRILASLLLGAHVGWAGDWVIHVTETLEDLGRALGSGLLQLWGSDQDRTAELADIVAAKRHVLGNIEPVKRLVYQNVK